MTAPASLMIPGSLAHSAAARTDADLAREVRSHFDAHAGVRFLSDVLVALHVAPSAVRDARAFYRRFPAAAIMRALVRRPDLRGRLTHAITVSPLTLLRRAAPDELARLIELLVEQDLPSEERQLRREEDRSLSVVEIYLKYLDPTDLATYLAPRALWSYERDGAWWRQPTAASQRLIAAEIKSLRRHKILTDTELMDVITEEVFERDLPLTLRKALRIALRQAARDGRPFTDTDVFDSVRTEDGTRDLIDELSQCVPLPHLRRVLDRAATVLGLAEEDPPSESQSVATSDNATETGQENDKQKARASEQESVEASPLESDGFGSDDTKDRRAPPGWLDPELSDDPLSDPMRVSSLPPRNS